jgi:hypothetical protein
MVNKGVSPPISARLQELSNNLKSLCSSTPLRKKLPEAIDVSSYGQVSADILEPKTPTMEQSMRANDRLEVANISSPWETFSMCNSGMKVRSNFFSNTFASWSLSFLIATHVLLSLQNSLVQEYVKFLNTANK